MKVQLAHLAVEVERLQGWGVSGGPKKALGATGRPRSLPAPVPKVVAPTVSAAARKRILARATFTADVRKSGDAVRMNVGAVLAEVVDRNQVTSGQLREELEALRLSVNELCKVLK